MVEQEADELVAKFGTPRRTAIITDGAPRCARCAMLWFPAGACWALPAPGLSLQRSPTLLRRGDMARHVSRSAHQCLHPPPHPQPLSLLSPGEVELRQEDVIPNTPSLVVYSRRGYIKRMRADAFDVQRLGGKGACRRGGAGRGWELEWGCLGGHAAATGVCGLGWGFGMGARA